MKSGRRYVRKDFVAVALAVCFMCCGCGNGQEEALADTVIGRRGDRRRFGRYGRGECERDRGRRQYGGCISIWF